MSKFMSHKTLVYAVLSTICLTVLSYDNYTSAKTAIDFSASTHHNDIAHSSATSSHLKTVFANPELSAQLSQFLDNVLRQVPAPAFWKLVDRLDWQNCTNDQTIYSLIMANIHTIKPQIQLLRKLAALKNQKTVLTKQALELLGPEQKFTGAVEIGSPATYISSLQHHSQITGDIYVINDTKRITDKVQAFTIKKPLNGFVPNNKFVTLNNYNPLSATDIPDQSVDLVICYIGLHHAPQEKLIDFIASIARVLRPNGVLLLREHDAKTPALIALTSAAHSLFNAIMNGETVATEIAEYRNFQALTYWIKLLEAHQFTYTAGPLFQAGDPTQNALLKFTKQANGLAEELTTLSRTTQKLDATYERALVQSYLTTPEWVNVDVSEAYAQFINHTPFYEFPYIASVKTYWQCFGNAWQAAAKRQGRWHATTSPHMLMSTFIGVTMTIEYAAKSLISAPVRWAYAGSEPEILKAIIQDEQQELAQLQTKIKVLEAQPKHNLLLVELPRHKLFLQTLKQLQQSKIVIHEIAGQKEIQVKLRFAGAYAELVQTCPYAIEYHWQLPTKANYTYAAITLPVQQLLTGLQELEARHCEVLYVHDF